MYLIGVLTTAAVTMGIAWEKVQTHDAVIFIALSPPVSAVACLDNDN